MLKSIKLTNVGCHRDKTFNFTEGKNIILGKNGTGKSTIFTAIGIGLFAYNDNSLKHIVNYKSDTGTIKIEYGDYTIIRDFGADSYYSLREGEQEIANGKDQIIPYLQEILKLKVSPPVAFPNLIGVPQNTLRTLFLTAPKTRKEVFDKLLGAYDYELAWSRLKNSYGKNLLLDLEQKERDLTTQITLLEKSEKRVEELGYSIKQTNRKLNLSQQELPRKQLEQRQNKDFIQASLEYTFKCSELNSLASRKQVVFDSIKEIEALKPRQEELQAQYESHLIDLELYADERTDWVNKKELVRLAVQEKRESIVLLKNNDGVDCPTCFQYIEDSSTLLAEQEASLQELLQRFKECEYVLEQPEFDSSELDDIKSQFAYLSELKKETFPEIVYPDKPEPKDDLTDEIITLEKHISQLETQIKLETEEHAKVQNDLLTLESKRTELKQIAEDKLDVKTTNNTIADYRTHIRSLGPLVLSSHIERIGQRANEIIADINPYKVEMSDTYALKANGLPFSMLSGGEKVLVSFVVRQAMIELLSDTGLFLMDEFLGSLDKKNKNNLVDYINRTQDNQYIIITHDNIFDGDNVISL